MTDHVSDNSKYPICEQAQRMQDVLSGVVIRPVGDADRLRAGDDLSPADGLTAGAMLPWLIRR